MTLSGTGGLDSFEHVGAAQVCFYFPDPIAINKQRLDSWLDVLVLP